MNPQSAKPSAERHRLPWTYWAFLVVYVLFGCAVGVACGLTWGIDPYLSALALGGAAVIREAVALKLKRHR